MAHRGFPGILPGVGAFPPRGAGPVPEEEAQVGEAELGPDLRGHGEGEGVGDGDLLEPVEPAGRAAMAGKLTAESTSERNRSALAMSLVMMESVWCVE